MWVLRSSVRSFALSPLDGASVREAHCEQASTTKNKPDYNTIIFFIEGRTWYFVLNVIICLFSGGGMVMWTNTHCFDFFSCNLIYIASICAKLQTFRISIYIN